jgi:hypothetical protein
MKRKLYNLGTLASLLLLCATLWWWNHSSRNTDQVSLRGLGDSAMQLTGSGGQVMLTSASGGGNGSGGELSWSSKDAGEGKFLATSFAFNNHPKNGLTLILPLWALAFCFAVAPGMWAYGKFKKKGGKKKPEGGH